MLIPRRLGIFGAALLCPWIASVGRAQTPALVEFDDPDSSAVCGVINTFNAQFAVAAATSQLVKINGTDTLFEDFTLDEFDSVFVAGEARGFVIFRTDVDGNRGLWWVTLVSENAVELDEFTGDVFDSTFRPSELGGTRCDPEALLDPPPVNENVNDNTDGGIPPDFGNIGGLLCGNGMLTWMLPMAGLLTAGRRRLLQSL